MIPIDRTFPIMESQRSPSGEIANLAKELFGQDSRALRIILEPATNISFIRSILSGIIHDQDHTEYEKGELLKEIFDLIPLPEVIAVESLEYSTDLPQIYYYIREPDQKDRLIQGLLEQHSTNPFASPLIQILPLFYESELWSGEEKTMQLCDFIERIPEEKKSEFFDCAVADLSLPVLGKLFALIDDELLANEFLSRFMQKYERQEDFNRHCLALIEAYVEQLDQEQKNRACILEKLLAFHEDKFWLDPAIFNQIQQYSNLAKLYLIKEGNREQRMKIMRSLEKENEIETIDPMLDHLFLWIPEQEKRIELVGDLFAAFNFDEYESVLQDLCEIDSIMLPYLFLALDEESFFHLAFFDSEVYSEAARHAIGAPAEVIQDIVMRLHENHRAFRMLRISRLDIAPQEFSYLPVNYTFEKMFALIDGMIHSENPENVLEDYQEDLQRIPEFLLSLATPNPEFRSQILLIMKYFSERQIRAVAYSIPELALIEFLDQASLMLLGDQFGHLLTNLPQENLLRYCETLATRIDEFSDQMNENHQTCFHLLIDEQNIEEAKKAYVLYSQAAKKLQLSIWSCLDRYLKPLSGEVPEIHDLLTKVQRMRSEMALFPQRRKQILDEFSALESDESSEDEKTISNGYWDLIVAAHLPHFELDHLGELEHLGIRSDRDFELLGLSPERRTACDRICQTINRLQNDETDIQVRLHEGWENLLLVAFQNTNRQTPYKELVALFGLEGRDDQIEQVQRVLESILALEWVAEEKKKKLAFLYRRAWLFETLEEKRAFCLQTIQLCVRLIVEQNFHIQLKRYLTQPQIRTIWEFLGIMNIFSLHQLKETGLIGSDESFYDLLSIAKLLGYSEAASLSSSMVDDSTEIFTYLSESTNDTENVISDMSESETSGDESSVSTDNDLPDVPLPTPPTD